MTAHYSPQDTEQKWYAAWEEAGLFNPDTNKDHKETYAIVIPPPNVTGSLHIGHALVNTIQDIVIRRQRMKGKKTLWLPGTDHAGIATQMVVERELLKQGIKRTEIGRDEFLKKVWEWKERSGVQIFKQLRRLGASLDWSRECFTMDKKLSRAVREAFVRMYEQGMIYRGSYMTNWCPHDKTAISDLEVDHKEEQGQISYIRYKIEGSDETLTVATTRPETLLGDTGVAVNPNDERYKKYIGKQAIVPLVNRPVPIVGDEHCDPEFGTGVVKITPGHDPNDYLIGKRHNLPEISIFDGQAAINDVYPPLSGMDRFKARKQVLEELEKLGQLDRVEPHKLNIGRCQRCQTIIEPLISIQWFCRTKDIAAQVLEHSDKGDLRFYPDFQTKTFQHWMTNIEDWCISRQLWWGHRIPAWHCEDCGTVNVTTADELKACKSCGSSQLKPETDVLDTWFSSGLFPFSTMGWPDSTDDMRDFYPNSLLVTGYDILFFWVARMLMMGKSLTGRLPFPDVYLHGLVRDENGEKMSKTKNNVIDPLVLIEEYGADALRFTLAFLNYSGRDLKLGKDSLQNTRAFLNKLWNAHKFILMQNGDAKPAPELKANIPDAGVFDLWIIKRFHTAVKNVDFHLDKYEFHEAASVIYNFIWLEFCDWYIEASKPALFGKAGEQARESARRTISYVFYGILRLAHPFMPFITEELASRLFNMNGFIMTVAWPDSDREALELDTYEAEQVFAVVGKIRTIRGENNIPPNVKLNATVKAVTPELQSLFKRHETIVMTLSKLDEFGASKSAPAGEKLSMLPGDGWDVYVDLGGAVDKSATDKIAVELKKLEARQETLERQLGDEKFTGKAPAHIVEKSKQELDEIKDKITRIRR